MNDIFSLPPEQVLVITAGDLQEFARQLISRTQEPTGVLTTEEVIRDYRTSWSTLSRLRKAGVLHPIRLGAQWRWPISELQKLNN